MSRRPEIPPEIRGLIEEIVADPRSAIRLVPKAPLLDWFERGDVARAGNITATAAEKYLVTAHREALAEMLLQAARIAYWKAPMMTVRQLEQDGLPFDSVEAERAWRPLAERRVGTCHEWKSEVGLLKKCLSGGIRPEDGHQLARASLCLVPYDRTRFFVAQTLPGDRARTAIRLFDRLARGARSPFYLTGALSLQAIRMCDLELYPQAQALYREAIASFPGAIANNVSLLNLSCFEGNERAAYEEAKRINEQVSGADPRIRESIQLLRGWYEKKSGVATTRAKSVLARLNGRVPGAAGALIEALAQ